MKRLAFLVIILLLLASCASTGSARKCSGQRGTRVPMGVM
jgi:hypothetical protein